MADTPIRAPRVIVIQMPTKRDPAGGADKPAFDYSPAVGFGQVEVLAPNGKHVLTPDVFREYLLERLADYVPDHDYIIPVGDYSVLFLVGMILGDKFKRARILRWVPAARAYQPLVFDVR